MKLFHVFNKHFLPLESFSLAQLGHEADVRKCTGAGLGSGKRDPHEVSTPVPCLVPTDTDYSPLRARCVEGDAACESHCQSSRRYSVRRAFWGWHTSGECVIAPRVASAR